MSAARIGRFRGASRVLPLILALVASMLAVPMSQADARARTVTVRHGGAVAKLPAGWRTCYGDQLIKARSCNQPSYYSAPIGGIEVQPWSSRYRGDTCTRQHFTNGRPGPRVKLAKRITKHWKRQGWASPYATRTIVKDSSGGHNTIVFWLVCARTADRRVVSVSFQGLKSKFSKSIRQAVLVGAASITAAKVPVYLPGGYPKRIKPSFASFTGDGTGVWDKLHWKKWSTRSAVGHGREGRNDCRPSCGGGHFSYYPVTLHAKKPQYLRCGMFFSTIVVRYVKRVPPHSKRTWTFRVDPSYNAVMLYTIGPCSD